MGRILLLVIIAFLVWLAFRSFVRANTRADRTPPAPPVAGEDMVACARCGVNMPRSEALVEAGSFYCRDNPKCLPPK